MDAKEVKMDAKKLLKKVVLLNIEDAKRLVDTFKAKGDSDGLQRAREDLAKWKTRARDLGITESE